MLGLNMAIKSSVTFGIDFIFPYGPLGYILTGLPTHVSEVLIIAFYLFLGANAFYFILYFLRSSEDQKQVVFFVIIFLIFGKFLVFRDTISLLFFAVFQMCHYLKSKRKILLLTISIICIISFYSKVSTGLIVNLLFTLFLLYILLSKSITWKNGLILFASHFLVLYALSFPLNTAFFSYIRNSLPIIGAYNDAMMVIQKDNTETVFALILILTALLPILLSLKAIVKSANGLVIVFLFGGLSYVLFKYAFVRADDYHQDIFFRGFLFSVLLLYHFTPQKQLKSYLSNSLLIISLLSLWSFDHIKHWDTPKSIFMNYDHRQFDVEKRKLPNRVLDQIGSKSIDVLGYELSYLYHNDLNYCPRPVIQSYAAYHSSLIHQNYIKFKSQSAPEFVLYHFGSIDDRHPFWDDSEAKIALFENYHLVDSFHLVYDSLLLFKKVAEPKKLVRKTLSTQFISPNSEISIPKSDKIILAELHYEYSLIGKLKRFLFQPSLVNIHFKKNSHLDSFRLLKPVMASGVPINKSVRNFNDAYKYFNSFGKSSEPVGTVDISCNPLWFADSFNLKFVEISIDLESQ